MKIGGRTRWMCLLIILLGANVGSWADEVRPVSRILFGSCVKQNLPAPLFEQILEERPEVFVFLGDNIYGDTEDMAVMRSKYRQLSVLPGFERLRESCRVFATWDDHDFGVNDGGADYPRRAESQREFVDFWKLPANSPARSRDGIYDAHLIGPPGQRVQLIMLDTRYFRSPLKRGERRVGGPYYPDADPAKTVLGEDQWKWLETQLREPAELRLVASSIQFAAEAAGQETWSNLPLEQQRLANLIRTTRADGVVVISGDRHWSELSVRREGVPYPVYDLTSSSINQVHPRGTPTDNSRRALPTTYHRPNYGFIDIEWEADPALTLQIRDAHGHFRLEHEMRLSEISH